MNSALRTNETLLWLGLILLATVVLRFAGLDFQSYWYDELFSAYYSNPDHSFDTVVALTLADVHPPLYQLMMWVSYKVFGYTEWAGRFPSALAGVLTVYVIFLLGRDLFSRRAGLYAAALAAVNYYLIYYGQEARSYAVFCFLSSLSFLFFLRAFRTDAWHNMLWYVLATLALIYTHYFGLVVLVAQGLCALTYFWVNGWSNRNLLTRGGVSAGVIILATLPLLPAMLGHADIDEFWITQPGAGFIAVYFLRYFDTPMLAIPMALLVVGGIMAGLSKRYSAHERMAVLMLLIWLFVGYGLPWLRGVISQPVLIDRNTIMLLVPLMLFAGFGLAALPFLKVQRIILVALLAFGLWHLFGQLGYYTTIKKNQYRETAAAMGAFKPALPVYTLKMNDTKYNVYFIQQESGLVAQDMTELEPLLAQGSGPALMWFADGHRRTLETDIDERFDLVEVGRVTNKATVAALMLDPARAVRLTLQKRKEGRYTSAQLPAMAGPVQLLVVAPGAVTAELLQGRELIATDSGDDQQDMPASLVLPELPAGAVLSVQATETPVAWLLPAIP